MNICLCCPWFVTVKKKSLVLSYIFLVSYPPFKRYLWYFIDYVIRPIDPGPDVPTVKPEGPPFPLALQSGSWQTPSQTPVKVPAGDSLPQQAISLPPLSQTSWASQTIPITLRLFKQTAAQFPSPEPQLRDSLGPTLTTSLPHPKPLSGKSSLSRDNGSASTVGSFTCLNVCRHLVKCPRPSFQRTIPPRCVCLSRQSQIRGRLPPFFKSQECKTEAGGNAVGGWGKFH